MSRLRGWRLPLRIAWRDARRARGRSLLVLVMIALPVLAVSIAATVYSTASLDGAEGIERRVGAAQARVQLGTAAEVAQVADPDVASFQQGDDVGPDGATLDDVRAALAEDLPAIELRYGATAFVTDVGVADAQVVQVDLDDPLAQGLAELSAGRWPRGSDEVVANAALLERGPEVGGVLELADGSTRAIVGSAESTSSRSQPWVFGEIGSLDVPHYGQRTYLVGGDPVTWSQVRELNGLGVTVLSRAVLADPPSADELAPEAQMMVGGIDDAALTVLALVVVMVLIEVVLLAGPAFAVGARRQTRTLALIAAAGGSPRDARRVVLGAGVVLGLLGALVGIGLGLVGARLLMPLFQSFSDSPFGPFDVTWLHLLGVGVFGLVSALLAAAVPAFTAARQDVVAVLGGRRGDTRASRRSPLLGLVLLAAGVAGSAYGALGRSSGEIFIAGSAILAVLGMVLVVPVVVVGVARLARRLPLTLRFAARDAARHRTRTVPAVAAVAATVAGVVALGIAITSDEAQNAATYQAQLSEGDGFVTGYGRRVDWASVEQVLARELPGADVRRVQGIAGDGDGVDRYVELRGARGERQGEGQGEPVLWSWAEGPGGSFPVSDGDLPATLTGLDELSDADRGRAREVLAAGGVVVLSDSGANLTEVRMLATVYDQRGRRVDRVRTTVPALTLPVTRGAANAQAVVSTPAAAALGIEPATTALVFDGTWSAAQEQDAEEVVNALGGPSFYVEHGYETPDEIAVVQLILGALGAVLMLGGTLTATFLALSDARPDLATLSAVGASPRTRRGVAAAYALVVGLVGAVLGALVGLVPGIAISYPLTAPYGSQAGEASHYLEVPWLLLGVVVLGLPLLTAAVVGLAARSRLPLVARLE
ncbi:FtsX-like permease family protein [Nocardioides dokdonensis FR1436]|uniref:FtsX-like permease family protein n=1 Tax=Nocardioides dokdonensis FR1436 TaxID=1300347 RepID=A0A1A9GJA0_9ACTN|nr:ABC transporter permease [Nocardioides dokdonensis]ANH37545.1 FtsX-like permease family protein [Nocardioides dokdonensis FR1436]